MSATEDIVLSPDPRLKQQCAPIEEVDASVRRLAKRMLKDMYAADGCGLAGPQVGAMRQIVVIDCDYGQGKKNPYVLINPKVVVADGDQLVGLGVDDGDERWSVGYDGDAPTVVPSTVNEVAVVCTERETGFDVVVRDRAAEAPGQAVRADRGGFRNLHRHRR